MSCPIGPEWKALQEKVGTKLAYKIYMANGEEVPSNVDEMIKSFNTSIAWPMELNRSFLSREDEDEMINIERQVEKARTDYPDYFKDLLAAAKLVKQAKGYARDAASEPSHISVSDAISRLRSRKIATLEERVQERADKIWLDQDPNVAKTDSATDSNKPMTKQEFIDYEINRELQYTVRGTLFDLAVQYALSSNEADRDRIDKEWKEVASTIQGRYAEDRYYSWIWNDPKHIAAIIDRLNLNILDETDNPDKFELQPVLYSDDLKVAGTPDVLVTHGKHEYSIVDIKSGFMFGRETSSDLIEFGRSFSRELYQNPRDLAKLQLTWYAVLTKLMDPEATFKALKIAWITNKTTLLDPTEYKAYVDLENTLPVIEAYLRKYDKEGFDKIIAKQPDLFKVSSYRVIASAAERILAKSQADQRLDKLTREVQYLTMFKKSPLGEAMKDEIAGDDGLLMSYLSLNPDNIEKVMSFHNVKDLSFGEYVPGSIHNIKNPYVKAYQEIVDQQFTKVQQDIAARLFPFKDLAKELYVHYMQNRDQNIANTLLSMPSRAIVGFGTGSSKILNRLDHKDMWGWAYTTDIRDGEEIERLVLTEEELMENAKQFKWLLKDGKPHPAAMKILKLVNSTYAMILDQDNPKSMWNEAAASFTDSAGVEKFINFGETINSTVSRKKVPYKWYNGWFAKAPKMPEEFGGLFSKAYYKNMYRHYFTAYNDYHFEELRSNEELIPIRGLGSKTLDASRNYSVSLEHQFEYFLKSAMMKRHMSSAYAIGQAIRFRIEHPTQLGENKEIKLPRLDSWIELQNEKLLRNRVADLPPIFSRALPFVLRAKGPDDDAEALNLDLKKILGTLGQLTGKIVLGGKIFGGLKNQIFINMYGVKEGIKNDILAKMGKNDTFPGIQNKGAFVNFNVSDLAVGAKRYLGVQKDSMQGNLNQNKIWILMNKHAFTPTISPFRSEERIMTTGKDTLLSGDLLFLPYSLGEEQFVTSVYSAMLDHMKIDKPGHEFHGKSVFEMYEKYEAVDEATGYRYTDYKWKDDPKTGKPFVRAIIVDSAQNRVELTGLNQKELSYMYALYEKMQGGYHPMQRTILETHVFGQMFIQFHRYLPSIMRNMFNSKGMNYTEGKYLLKGREEDGTPITEWTPRITEGRWNTVLGVFLEYARLSKLVKGDNKFTKAVQSVLPSNIESYKINDLSEAQLENLVDTAVTTVFWTLMNVMHFLAFGSAPDKKKLDQWSQNIIDNFYQQISLVQLVQDISSGPAMFKTMARLIKGSADLSQVALWYAAPDFLRQTLEEDELIKASDEEKQNKKALKAAKNLPYGAAIIDANDRIQEILGDE